MDANMEDSTESAVLGTALSDSNVQVVVRVRPPNSREQEQGYSKCIVVDSASKSIALTKPQAKNFTFDFVADEDSMQEDLFAQVGKPITDACMQGYHCCLLAYGQTGAGKTYTMEGPECDEDSLPGTSSLQGLIPRVLKYIFSSMAATKEQDYTNVEFEVKCSYLQIYNEQVSDLLDIASQNLSIREDSKRGMFVDGLQEVVVSSAEATYSVFKRGSQNRQVGLTAMNEESSRSHSVFTIKMESQRRNEGGLMKRRTSNFYLVDLAGSERQKHSEAVGLRLKEAGSINKSLSALGNVIKALVEIGEGKVRHVPYRDSKLTFLLKDALGGNSKCSLVANVSPAEKNAEETLSTLKFAQRAKLMRNDAVVNEDMFGNPAVVAEMLRKMKLELAYWKAKCGDTTAEGHPAEALQALPQESENATINRLAKLVINDHRGEMRAREELNKQVAQHRAVKECHDALVERYQKEVKSLKLVVRLRDENIKRLGGAHPPPTRDEELSAMQEEIESLRSQVDHHPDVLRFKMELDEAKEQLEELEDETRSREALQGDLEAETKLKLDLSVLLEDIQKENKDLHAKVETAESEAGRVKQALEGKEEHCRSMEQRLAQLNTRLAVTEDELNQSMRRTDIAEANSIQMTQELSQQKSQMNKTFQEQSRLQEDLMMELERLSGACEQAKMENQKIYPELERVRAVNEEMTLALAALRAQVVDLEHGKATAEGLLEATTRAKVEAVKNSAMIQQELEARLEACTAENATLAHQLGEEKARKEEAEEGRRVSEERLQESNDQLTTSEAGRMSSEEKAKELRGLLEAAEGEQVSSRAREADLKAQVAAGEEENQVVGQKLEATVAEYKETLAALGVSESELEAAKERLAVVVEEKEGLKSLVVQRESELREVESRIEEKENEMARQEVCLSALRDEKSALEEAMGAARLEKSAAEAEFQAALQEASGQTAAAERLAADRERSEQEVLGRLEAIRAALEVVTGERDEALALARAAEDQAEKVGALGREIEVLQQARAQQDEQVIELARQVGERDGKLAGAEEKHRRSDENMKLLLGELNETRACLEQESSSLGELSSELQRFRSQAESETEKLQGEVRQGKEALAQLQGEVEEERWRCQVAEDRRLTAEGALKEAEKMRRVAREEGEELRRGLEAEREVVVDLQRKLKEAGQAEEERVSALTEELRGANEGLQEVEQKLHEAEGRERAARSEVEEGVVLVQTMRGEVQAAEEGLRTSKEAERSLRTAVEGMASRLAEKEGEVELAEVELLAVQEMLDVAKGKVVQGEERIAALESHLREVMDTGSALKEVNKQLLESESALKEELGVAGVELKAMASLDQDLRNARERIKEQEQQLKESDDNLAQLSEKAHAKLEEEAFKNGRLRGEMNEMEKEVSDLSSKVEELKETEKKLEALLGEHNTIMGALQAQELQSADDVAALAEDAIILREEAASLNAKLEASKASLRSVEAEKEALLQSLEVKEGELKSMLLEQASAEEKLKSLNEAREKERDCLERCASREKEVEDLQSKIGELNNLTKSMREQNEAQARQVSQMRDEQRGHDVRLREVIDSHTQTLAGVEERVALLQLEHSACQERVEGGARDLATVQQELTVERGVCEEIRGEREACEVEIRGLKSALEERDARMDEVQRGTDDAIKTVMEQLSQQKIKNGTLQGRIKELEGHVGQLQWEAQGVERLELDKKKLKGKLRDLQEREKELDAKWKAAEGRVGVLEGRLGQLQQKLEGTEGQLRTVQEKFEVVERMSRDLRSRGGADSKMSEQKSEGQSQKETQETVVAPKGSVRKPRKRPSPALSATPSAAAPSPRRFRRLSSLVHQGGDTPLSTPASHPPTSAHCSNHRAPSENLPGVDTVWMDAVEKTPKRSCKKQKGFTSDSPLQFGDTPSPALAQSEEIVADVPKQKKAKTESTGPGSHRKPLTEVEFNVEPNRSSPAPKPRQYNLRQRSNDGKLSQKHSAN